MHLRGDRHHDGQALAGGCIGVRVEVPDYHQPHLPFHMRVPLLCYICQRRPLRWLTSPRPRCAACAACLVCSPLFLYAPTSPLCHHWPPSSDVKDDHRFGSLTVPNGHLSCRSRRGERRATNGSAKENSSEIIKNDQEPKQDISKTGIKDRMWRCATLHEATPSALPPTVVKIVLRPTVVKIVLLH